MSSTTSLAGAPNHETDSPCIGLCTTCFDDICRGCGRQIGEVSQWCFMTPAERVVVWQRIEKEGTCVRMTEPHRIPK
jgi:predicted Fe-S protein YdhL (DUF1289 family)